MAGKRNNAMNKYIVQIHIAFVDFRTNKRMHAFIKQLTSKWNLY